MNEDKRKASDHHKNLLVWIDAEINLEESDHARNAGSAWVATVFAVAGLLIVGSQTPDHILARLIGVLFLVALSLAALMFVDMQFSQRWESAENSAILRTLRSELRAGSLDLLQKDLKVPDGAIHPAIVHERLKPESDMEAERRAAVKSAIRAFLKPRDWSSIDARARSEAPCYVAIGVVGVMSILLAIT